MIELMQEYSGISVVIIGTIIYMLGIWRGGYTPSASFMDKARNDTVSLTTSVVIATLVNDGYLCSREEERDGKNVSIIVPYEEFFDKRHEDECATLTSTLIK